MQRKKEQQQYNVWGGNTGARDLDKICRWKFRLAHEMNERVSEPRARKEKGRALPLKERKGKKKKESALAVKRRAFTGNENEKGKKGVVHCHTAFKDSIIRLRLAAPRLTLFLANEGNLTQQRSSSSFYIAAEFVTHNWSRRRELKLASAVRCYWFFFWSRTNGSSDKNSISHKARGLQHKIKTSPINSWASFGELFARLVLDRKAHNR